MSKNSKRKRGRPRKDGPRDKNDRLIPEGKFEAPPPHVAERRALFANLILARPPQFVAHEDGLRPIDNTSDGIGQLWLLGKLDDHGFDDQELRDIGRRWRDLFLKAYRPCGFKGCNFERTDGSSGERLVGPERLHPSDREWFRQVDSALEGYERSALVDLLIDPIAGSWPDGEEDAQWALAIISHELRERGRYTKKARFPTPNDWALLDAAIRGLLILKDASLPSRWEQRRVA